MNVAEVAEKKETATQILNDATFQTHKWASNAPELEASSASTDPELTAAKTQLGVTEGESKVLGVGWDKVNDTFIVRFGDPIENVTKRTVLGRLARIYDPLGIAGLLTLIGKQIYRAACDTKQAWDVDLPHQLQRKYRAWETALPKALTVKRSLVNYQEPITAATLHAFGDASANGVAAVVYSVFEQLSGVTQRLIAARTRLAKRGLTIPRLELVGSHMAVNLLSNVYRSLADYLPSTQLMAWSDSTVVLWWLKGNDNHMQFVNNRIQKIQSYQSVHWRHVPTDKNSADLGSRGGKLTSLWIDGPPCLKSPEKWPLDIVVQPSKESRAESKPIREVMATTVVSNPEPQVNTIEVELLKRYTLKKTLRILTWIYRFLGKSKTKQRQLGPLQFQELRQTEEMLIKIAQRGVNPDDYKELNLQTSPNGLLMCHGRLQGDYPFFLPRNSFLAGPVVQRAHKLTLHGGVASTMAKVREKYWIPQLRSLVKTVRRSCYRCRRYQAQPYPPPSQATLPLSRTTAGEPYAVVGIDYAGPIRYQTSEKAEGKAYLLIFACALTRGVHLELLRSQETNEFIQCFKNFVARRGRPQIVYSDNGLTFKAAAVWLEKSHQEERFQDMLADHEISWRFNLAKAPWWGGHYERLIGIFKSIFRRIVGKGLLGFAQLKDLVIDIEMVMNNRPLTYMEDEVEQVVLTPNSFLHGGARLPVDLEPHQIDDHTIKREVKRVKAAKEAVWQRWKREYKLTPQSSTKLPEKERLSLLKKTRVTVTVGSWPRLSGFLQAETGKCGELISKRQKERLKDQFKLSFPLNYVPHPSNVSSLS